MNLNKILQDNELYIKYQPQIDLITGKICGAEALLRMHRKDGVMILPGLFIPNLERRGKITEIDEQVVRMVCSDIREAVRKGIEVPPVSVNISRLNMGIPDTADNLKTIVESFGLDKKLLVFELTESGIYKDDKEDLMQLMGKIKNFGFQISLDDYGMGFSSLKLLADVQFNILKLDRYFVMQTGDARINAILRSVIKMAIALGVTPIAEGVETKSQVEFLKENGCRIVQGYYFFRPLSKFDFFNKLSGNVKVF